MAWWYATSATIEDTHTNNSYKLFDVAFITSQQMRTECEERTNMWLLTIAHSINFQFNLAYRLFEEKAQQD